MPSWRAPQRSSRISWAKIKTDAMGSVNAVAGTLSGIIGLLIPPAIGAGIAYLKGWDVKKGAIYGFLTGVGLSIVTGIGLAVLFATLLSRVRGRLGPPQGAPLPPLPVT